jgi:periplasmic glucans biosynthesis protein
LRALPLALALLLGAITLPARAFDFDDVAERARALAAKAYRAPSGRLPAELRNISYDQYRAIRFLPERSLWRGSDLPFEIQFFHPGFFYQHPVDIRLITADGVKPYRFNPDAFSYGALEIDRKVLEKLGYAGFRVHYPLNKRDYKDEFVVFLGASYLRAVGRNQGYGLSARGLAVDTALPSGEEFPAFREFWIEWPAPDAQELVVYALLDSPRVAGAYRFVLRPGETTFTDVRMRIFLRDAVGKLGIAPLTSMFYSGENHPSRVEDYRPEVHDSDGLSVAGGNGEWIWRPLANPRRLLVTSFAQENPKGFGLMQRDRLFAHYEDLEARYERRPSAWVEPRGDWGKGRVELVQIPSADEFNDNVVAFWVPEKLPEPGTPLELSYRVHWQMNQETAPPLGRVVQTRRGAAEDDRVRFLIDFAGDALGKDARLESEAWAGENAELLDHRAYPNEMIGGWRLVLTVRRKQAAEPVELRAVLRDAEGARTETWSYVWPGS